MQLINLKRHSLTSTLRTCNFNIIIVTLFLLSTMYLKSQCHISSRQNLYQRARHRASCRHLTNTGHTRAPTVIPVVKRAPKRSAMWMGTSTLSPNDRAVRTGSSPNHQPPLMDMTEMPALGHHYHWPVARFASDGGALSEIYSVIVRGDAHAVGATVICVEWALEFEECAHSTCIPADAHPSPYPALSSRGDQQYYGAFQYLASCGVVRPSGDDRGQKMAARCVCRRARARHLCRLDHHIRVRHHRRTFGHFGHSPEIQRACLF